MQEWNEQKLPKVLPGYSGGRFPGRSKKEKGREEGELDEDSEKRKVRNEIAQEVVAGIKEKVNAHDDAKAIAKVQLGKVSSKIGIGRKSKMKKRRKRRIGKRKPDGCTMG